MYTYVIIAPTKCNFSHSACVSFFFFLLQGSPKKLLKSRLPILNISLIYNSSDYAKKTNKH